MRRRIWTLGAGLAATAMIIAVPAALAAYTSAKLEVRRAGTTTIVKALARAPTDDPTASVRIYAPTGHDSSRRPRRPARCSGPCARRQRARPRGRRSSARGSALVAAPGQIPAVEQTACLGTTAPQATWIMVLVRGRSDADCADVPHRDFGRAGCARPRVHPDLPAAARRASGHARAARSSAQSCTAPSSRSRASSAPCRSAPGSRCGRPTTRASAP